MDIQSISQDIIKKAVSGDIQAFEEIYRSASSFVYNIALRTARNREDAQEITQEVFLKVFKSLKDFRFQSSFKTWLYRITVNTTLNMLKKTAHDRRRQFAYHENICNELPLPTAGIETSLEQREQKAQVDKMLEALNPEYRTCIVLREMQGLRYDEIAQALKININTVRSRLKRAREILLKRGGYNELP
ncbi:MAG: sigma-70 family RNA polymerase sigma factor [bacterium]|jgi:RNA polymerase sigma-70 factor (ECF subfamily)|nr:sigma-70 family RNA polymerase sigma factor [bacterium]